MSFWSVMKGTGGMVCCSEWDMPHARSIKSFSKKNSTISRGQTGLYNEVHI